VLELSEQLGDGAVVCCDEDAPSLPIEVEGVFLFVSVPFVRSHAMSRNRNAIGSHARNALSEMQLEMQTIGQRAGERMGELGDVARDRANTLQKNVEERIGDHPLKAVAIAAGVGLLLGFFWRR
jgi:ElaB/YqjD/DUF883 family membrane-anchored ribosome-binding protein